MTAEKNIPKSVPPSFQKISVIVPSNPFVRGELRKVRSCLAALNVEKLMSWWPGKPHVPHRDARKVRSIQRSLDWKRVAQIAAYLLQAEITNTSEKINEYFTDFYGSSSGEPGREWPPRAPKVVSFSRSTYPTFSNVLLHVNGAKLEELRESREATGVARLAFDENSKRLNFTVIDGQHRINGAYFALCLLRETVRDAMWDVPAEIFIDLDEPGAEPKNQAQIFIDINFNQKKVDRSLVADLYPTARGRRDSLDDKERAQDLGRKLMLEVGPLVGMIQIPGVRYGVSTVVTLATLNSAIEDILPSLFDVGIRGLEAQAEFLALCLEAWLDATGRRQKASLSETLDSQNVAYQGRVIVSFLTLIPACIWQLKDNERKPDAIDAREILATWLRGTMKRAGLLKGDQFLGKDDFKSKGFLGSGGLARFRDTLWASAMSRRKLPARMAPDKLAKLASTMRGDVREKLEQSSAS